MVTGVGEPNSQAGNIAQRLAQKTFRKLQNSDRNGDGVITRDEFKGGDKAFATLDADGDGAVTVKDLEQMFSPKSVDKETLSQIEELLKGFVKVHDKDGDGFLNFKEYGGDEKDFKRLDTDGDGKVSTRELAHDLADTLQKTKAQLAPLLQLFSPNKNEPNGMGRIRDSLRKQFEDFVKSRDEDGNGTLSANELGDAKNLLKSMDNNGDGELDAEEMTNYFVDALNGSGFRLGWADFKSLLLLLSPKEESTTPGSHFDTKA